MNWLINELKLYTKSISNTEDLNSKTLQQSNKVTKSKPFHQQKNTQPSTSMLPSTSVTQSQQILQKLFTSEPSLTSPQKSSSSNRHLRLNMKLLKQISEEKYNYKNAIELILILERILYTGQKRLSLRQLIYKQSGAFRNSQKSYTFSSSSGMASSNLTPKKLSQKPSSKEDIADKQSKDKQQKPQEQEQQPHLFISDELNQQEKNTLLECLGKIKSNLCNTIYQSKIEELIKQLSSNIPNDSSQLKKNYSEDQVYKKLIQSNGLGLDANKTNKIQQFLQKGYQSLDGKFPSFQALYTFLSNQILPLIERKILSISITNHQQRQSFLSKSINFLSELFLHQYIIEIKINKATLIENRIFVQKIFREQFKRHQALLLKNMTNVINEALLCPSNMQIQLPLFRLLKRMYMLWGVMGGGSAQFIQLKSDEENIGQFIKYPLLVNLKNISLYSKPTDNDDQLKEPAMFCYKVLNQKQDLYICSQIETLTQMRYLRDSKYFSSKAYAFSQEISKIYDTFDLRMGFWKYYKRVERGQVWVYNVLVEKPNSLLIWEFYLQGFDIGFGIYKVQGFKKHTIEEYTKQVQCKQILKLDKYTVTQSQPQKGFIFLKNGLYRLVFDNSYSKIRGKDLSYMILQLQSEN